MDLPFGACQCNSIFVLAEMRSACLALALVMLALPDRASAEIFVCATGSIRIFADSAAADDPPLRIIEGALTGVLECYDVAFDDVHGEIFVAHGPISVFDGNASGNVAPIRKVSGNATGIGFAATVAVDVQGNELIVGNASGHILTFPRNADGDVVPTRDLNISDFIQATVSIFIDRVHDEIAVSRYSVPGGGIYFFQRLQSGTGAPVRAPISTYDNRGLFLDAAADELYAATSSGILVFDRVGTQVRNLVSPGAITSPWGVAVTKGAELWVGNQSPISGGPDNLLVYDSAASADDPPIRQINNAAPAGTKLLRGIAASNAAACGAGHVACDSLFRDSFDRVRH